jgi:response regulator of citrate/malate metabolism
MKKVLIVDDQQAWITFNTVMVNDIFGQNIVLHTASSGTEAYNLLLENILNPYDYIITDLQMEDDYMPKTAGEWLVEQAKGMSFYEKTNIIIVSAAPFISHIAERLGVNYIRKQDATASKDIYKDLIK